MRPLAQRPCPSNDGNLCGESMRHHVALECLSPLSPGSQCPDASPRVTSQMNSSSACHNASPSSFIAGQRLPSSAAPWPHCACTPSSVAAASSTDPHAVPRNPPSCRATGSSGRRCERLSFHLREQCSGFDTPRVSVGFDNERCRAEPLIEEPITPHQSQQSADLSFTTL
ncbi:unnamed protein product [Gadus morhua 'NCC']